MAPLTSTGGGRDHINMMTVELRAEPLKFCGGAVGTIGIAPNIIEVVISGTSHSYHLQKL